MAVNYQLITFLLLASAPLTAGAAVRDDRSCDEGWSPFGTRCFRYFTTVRTWSDAERHCHTFGGHLASVHSSEETTFLRELSNNVRTWVGGQDAFKEGTWMWTDASAFDYNNWPSAGQPDNADGHEHFLMINFDLPNADWNDGPESTTLSYICAKDLPKAESRAEAIQPSRFHPCICASNCFCRQVACI